MTMKQGDFGTKIYIQVYDDVEDENGVVTEEVLDLTEATSVNAVMSLAGVRIEKEDITVEDSENGITSFILEDGDLAGYGTLKIEVAVDFGEGMHWTTTRVKHRVRKRL